MSEYVTISIKIKKELKEKLEKYNVKVSKILKKALEEYILQKELEDIYKEVEEILPLMRKYFSKDFVVKSIRKDREENTLR